VPRGKEDKVVEFGYALSSEEHAPNDLVRYARMAEEIGFTFALISDHYHPWLDAEGQSPFVWSVIGGIAQATERLRLGTGVTCPTFRYHPAIIAQAAATAAAMMPGRFFLGVGTGENLNEHVLGQRWPEYQVRAEMLEEAIAVIRLLWRGGYQRHHGRFYTVENARIYTLPREPTPIYVGAAGPSSAEMAGRLGDGLISVGPEAKIVQTFEKAGGAGKPRYAQATVCWGKDEATARKTAHRFWRHSALPGQISQELPTPAMFEQGARIVTEEMVAKSIVCGPDPEKHAADLQKFVDAGFDHIYIHQVGPDQEGFMRFYQREVLPRMQTAPDERMTA
jgi:coenzyme F420-dependent glucose-6-phosphate dehydrogenase